MQKSEYVKTALAYATNLFAPVIKFSQQSCCTSEATQIQMSDLDFILAPLSSELLIKFQMKGNTLLSVVAAAIYLYCNGI